MSEPQKFRKKPVVIDAAQLTSDNIEELAEWSGGSRELYSDSGSLLISTLEGNMIAESGDWVIRGVAGEFYPCKPDIFAETYELEP